MKYVLVLLMIFLYSGLLAQNNQVVKGVVVDTKQEPLIGVNVLLKGTKTTGAVTNAQGRFTLSVPANSILVVSYFGMVTQEVVASKKEMIITMEDDNKLLSEVVVVGYGLQKKESVVGAITQTSGEVLLRAGGVSDVGAALTGNLPGVITTASTGMPGEEDPHIVIRGRSSWNSSDPLVLVDGIERPMNSVDIGSIESISVLKDASATAVFGVKGANGVILITTKRGQEGKAVINVSMSATMKMPSKLPSKYDSYDALRLRNIAIERELGLVPDAWSDITPQEIIDKYRYRTSLEDKERYPNVDWADALFKDYTMSYNANVNISGGTKFVKYFASVDYQHEGDLFKEYDNHRGYNAGYGYNRLNVRSNLDFQLTGTTVLKTSLAGSRGVQRKPYSYVNEYTMWLGAYSVAPDVFLPVYSDGSWGYYAPNSTEGTGNSAATLALSGLSENTTTRLNTNFTLEQDLGMVLKGLKAQGTISWDNTFVESKRGVDDSNNGAQSKWIDPETGEVHYRQSYDSNNKFDFQEGKKWTTTGGSVDNNLTQRNLYYQLQLNYMQQFGNHGVTGMGMMSRQETAKGSEIPHYREDWAFRATYDFKSKYFLEYNGAYNGSEKFSADNRFAFFSSGALGWMITEENFMKRFEWLDMLKVRLSYGEIGDDNIDKRWLYMTQWEYGAGENGSTALMGLQGERSPYVWYREKSVGNEDVHWEKVRKMNIGVDYAFLDGLIAGSVEVFKDKRTDILVGASDRSVPSYYGATVPTANLGKVETKGYEIEIRLNKKIKDVRLWGNFNITHAKDKILEKDDAELLPEYRKEAGKAMDQTKSYVSSGYYNTWDELYGSTQHSENDAQKLPGNYNIIDYNGDGVINKDDEIPYGYSGTPQNTYNATIGFEWKGFSGFVQFYGVNNVTRQVVFGSFPNRMNTVYDEGSFWSKDNTSADVPMPRWISTPSSYNSGTRYMYDGSYVRLKNVELAYTFGQDWGFMRKMGMKSLKLYVNGNNLWLWSKMPDDRESNFAATGWASQGAYPTVKRINFGLKFTL